MFKRVLIAALLLGRAPALTVKPATSSSTTPLNVSGGRAVLPTVVLEEARAVYERRLTAALKLVEAANRDVRRIVAGCAPTAVDVPAQV